MFNERIYNFSAGPSMLPLPVLEQAAAEMTNYRGSGMSVMEMSHRSKAYLSIFEETKADFKRLLAVPDTHEILFMQGGATLQFAAVPMNLIGTTGKADYANSGNFANLAAKEAKKYGEVRIAASSEDKNHTYIPAQSALKISPDAAYFHYCANNTIEGTEWKYIPATGGVPLACDMSSNIMSKPVDVSKYGVIYAGVQKNMAPAGMAVVILDKKLAGKELAYTPKLMSYQVLLDSDSMHNTPPCYTIYMLGLVLKWLDRQGGLAGMEKIKAERAKILYDYLDGSPLFKGCASPEARSDMNVTFRTGNEELDAKFAKEAAAAGFENLKGHRNVGGMRASIYNAMPTEGVVKLVEFMKNFELKNK
ncbi:phosphoserine aminotransferase apoenzyme [Sporobacter termitidis DSM 10068]|uniref:Phosphoserine aminotransferase n=1 Tax=Sporobacter termitidis DSM 10068 TaxID=1123282 RepID=A0A1M5YF14_9FIRM|nr:3-phosphoserine/phosphohydroxythreonine transaminase [Sporobacter termitidis]SHI10651.1 phosphoserine aminotransferase apoenzyme [Sporobacter termitidis DSM 10068]